MLRALDLGDKAQQLADKCFFDTLVTTISRRLRLAGAGSGSRQTLGPPTADIAASGVTRVNTIDINGILEEIISSASDGEARRHALALACHGTLSVLQNPGMNFELSVDFGELDTTLRTLFPLEPTSTWDFNKYAEAALCAMRCGRYDILGRCVALLLDQAARGRDACPDAHLGKFWRAWRVWFGPPPPPPPASACGGEVTRQTDECHSSNNSAEYDLLAELAIEFTSVRELARVVRGR